MPTLETSADTFCRKALKYRHGGSLSDALVRDRTTRTDAFRTSSFNRNLSKPVPQSHAITLVPYHSRTVLQRKCVYTTRPRVSLSLMKVLIIVIAALLG